MDQKLKCLLVAVFTLREFCANSNDREGRLFPLLSVVVFANSPCQDANMTTGSCLSTTSCSLWGGRSTGTTCASGYGVCCIFFQTCGATVAQNNSYFINPGYPDASSVESTCTVLVEKLNSNVVQLRLNFDEFDVLGVTSRACEEDAFQVFGQDTNSVVPPICGRNNGQHVYVNVETVRGPVTLSMTTSGVGSRRWLIRVTQIERTNILLAPNGCLQYHTSPVGNVRSFNFDSELTSGESNFIRNLNYAICIRRESGYCSIQYVSDVTSFSLSGPPEVSLDTACANALGSVYIAVSRYCGGGGAMTSTTIESTAAGQFRLVFVTSDGIPSGTFRGFNLDYQQNLCSAVSQG